MANPSQEAESSENSHLAGRRQFSTVYEDFRMVLAHAQTQRKDREEFVPVVIRGRSYQEVAWAVFEAKTMWDAVNWVRSSAGQPGVTLDDIWRVEGTAKGHSDYSRKFALYCTELALLGKEAVAP